MLKYQVKTLNRGQQRRSSIFDEDSSLCSQGSGDSSASSSGGGGALGRRWCSGRCASVSSLSSCGSATDSHTEWDTIKVHTHTIRADTEYKTFFVSSDTTADDLIRMALTKFRLTYKDSKLYYVAMELRTKRAGADVETVLILDRTAKLLELQRCHPREMSRFLLKMRVGAPVRIYDYCLSPECNYKSLFVSRQTTCAEAIGLLLQTHRLPTPPQQYCLVCVNTRTKNEHVLKADLPLLSVQDQSGPHYQIHLRPAHTARLSRQPSFKARFSVRRPFVEIDSIIEQVEKCAI